MVEALGPVEYLVVDFRGNQFTGEIIPALNELVEAGAVRVIDLAVVSKDGDGNVSVFEAGELREDFAQSLTRLQGELTGMLSENDLMMVAEELENNHTAAAMLFENVWAAKFAQAVRNANGEVLVNVRVPNDIVETVRESLVGASA